MTEPISPAPSPKRILLGVSGSIAAYRAADIASTLVKDGFDVYPVLTPSAARFLGPVTLAALCGHACPVGMFDEPLPGEIAHIWYARNCDLFLLAPASMNLIARLAAGLADDMLTASVMATTAPVLLAPAMNTQMWLHPATQANIQRLVEYGYYFVDPISGRLACRTEGMGKIADTAVIVASARELLARRVSLAGKSVLVTAGPTREPIDPVRFIGNRSSGKMGYAIADAAGRRGARVTLVSGPTALTTPAGVARIDVETAAEMRDAALGAFAACDIAIAAAAVADYRPAAPAAEKIKKATGIPQIVLEQTDDILAAMGARRRDGQILVGFAAETGNAEGAAEQKLRSKSVDWIVVNDVTQPGGGFDVDTNIVTIIGRSGAPERLPLQTKREVAERILDRITGTPDLP
jgi:phosphopantothenoylcysteine decarboxylase/phosphopantothenate--cysteine ligase